MPSGYCHAIAILLIEVNIFCSILNNWVTSRTPLKLSRLNVNEGKVFKQTKLSISVLVQETYIKLSKVLISNFCNFLQLEA